MNKLTVAHFLHLNNAVNIGTRRVRWFRLPKRRMYRGNDRIMAIDRQMQIVPQGGGSSLTRTRAMEEWYAAGISR